MQKDIITLAIYSVSFDGTHLGNVEVTQLSENSKTSEYINAKNKAIFKWGHMLPLKVVDTGKVRHIEI